MSLKSLNGVRVCLVWRVPLFSLFQRYTWFYNNTTIVYIILKKKKKVSMESGPQHVYHEKNFCANVLANMGKSSKRQSFYMTLVPLLCINFLFGIWGMETCRNISPLPNVYVMCHFIKKKRIASVFFFFFNLGCLNQYSIDTRTLTKLMGTHNTLLVCVPR